MKKLISALLIFVVIFSTFTFAADDSETEGTYKDGYNAGYNAGYSDGADTVYKPKVPKVIFAKQEKIPEVAAGEILSISIDYTNDSSNTAKKITITPSFEDMPLVYERPIVYESEKSLRKNQTNTASFSFKVKDEAKKGVYGIKFKIEYENLSEENYSNEQIYYFKVIKENVKPLLTISDIITEPENVSAGEKFTLRFNINNIGDVEASEVSIKLTSLSTDTFMPVNGNDFAYVGTIGAKSFVTKSFDLIASKSIKKANNTLDVKVSYLNSDGEESSEEKTLYILDVLSENTSGDEVTGNKPKIIIESYSTNPKSIVAGQTISFSFKFKNTSRDKAVGNMKITISSEDGAFMIANGSNTFYIETLEPQGTQTKTIALNVKQDLTSKSYPINIAFDYEDSNSNSYQANEVINIPVVEYSNLVINSVYAGSGMIDQETSLSFDYINMGKAKVSNLTASVEGDYVTTQSINYIGNLEAGSSDYYDISIMPTKEGENVGTLVLAFEDSSGKSIEVRKEFTGYAMAAFSQDDYNQDYSEPGDINMPIGYAEEQLNIWAVIGAGVGSFLVAFIITKIITTKIVRKKLEDEI